MDCQRFYYILDFWTWIRMERFSTGSGRSRNKYDSDIARWKIVDWYRTNVIIINWTWSRMEWVFICSGRSVWHTSDGVIAGWNCMDWQRRNRNPDYWIWSRMESTIISICSRRFRHKYDIDIDRWNFMGKSSSHDIPIILKCWIWSRMERFYMGSGRWWNKFDSDIN
jgi:hypothetical protein